MDGLLSTRGVWVKDAVREPSLTGAACGRTGATGAWRGALDRRGGRLPPRSGARGGMRRAHQPTTEAARGHLAPVQGPRACAGTTGPLLHAVRPLQGTTRRAAAAPKRTRTTLGEEAALGALEDFAESDPWPATPRCGDAGEGQGRFTPFLDFPPMLRRVVYTTNAIESASEQLRKVTKNRSHYSPPTRPQLNYCGWRSATSRTNAPESATRTRANSPANAPPHPVSSKANSPPTAKQALTQLTTAYPDRITPYL